MENCWLLTDGLIEQWGITNNGVGNDNYKVNFPINFSDTNYYIVGTGNSQATYSSARYAVHSKTENSCLLYWNATSVNWIAKGY